MMKRVGSLIAALAVVLFLGTAIVAAKDAAKSDSTVIGTITKVGDGTITVTDKDGKDHALTVGKDAAISCDGKACKLADLDPTKVKSVTVTLNATTKTQADKIDAMTK
jgi:hypothetical protein